VGHPTTAQIAERRKDPRICVPFFANIQGVDAEGAPVKVDTVLDNLCIGGLYFRMMKRLPVGEHLIVVFQLSVADGLDRQGPHVEVAGDVLRTDNREGGAWGTAVRIVTVRFH
jgi:hypothetical protein